MFIQQFAKAFHHVAILFNDHGYIDWKVQQTAKSLDWKVFRLNKSFDCQSRFADHGKLKNKEVSLNNVIDNQVLTWDLSSMANVI